ncbi:MAG: ATP-binding protein [Candidatus Tantalella remota]|nr:ATP-binding protein [Candidatus Tantalella remota]
MKRTSIENDSHLLKEVSNELIEELREIGVNEEIIFDVHVGFEEALRNAMVHGNKGSEHKKVAVETKIEDNSVTIMVEDEGDGFVPESLPDPTHDDNLLLEGGRGVYLIKHLMDEVRYENGGRRLIMIKYLDRQHI